MSSSGFHFKRHSFELTNLLICQLEISYSIAIRNCVGNSRFYALIHEATDRDHLIHPKIALNGVTTQSTLKSYK